MDIDHAESGSQQPTWQVAPCPSWCRRVHRESDPLEDQIHQDEAVVVPVVIARVDDETLARSAHSAELVVQRFRHARPGSTEWVHIGEAEPSVGSAGRGIELSPESARRLRDAL